MANICSNWLGFNLPTLPSVQSHWVVFSIKMVYEKEMPALPVVQKLSVLDATVVSVQYRRLQETSLAVLRARLSQMINLLSRKPKRFAQQKVSRLIFSFLLSEGKEPLRSVLEGAPSAVEVAELPQRIVDSEAVLLPRIIIPYKSTCSSKGVQEHVWLQSRFVLWVPWVNLQESTRQTNSGPFDDMPPTPNTFFFQGIMLTLY